MTKEEFKAEYTKKGWTATTLAKRWGYTAATRIHHIAVDPHKNPYMIDAVRGLPYIIKEKI
ncbi:hypothetical protein [Vibrio scophthalmi]|uniref:Uncharacterized protein n=1 Tax=Vibrio scophthalmi LMG 19158 TaxID=870967 RepID=F9RN61_9VIBR|nr:hypothetical protein [Vibrio scophthalmi]EGU37416.1 hypothetical protein VIS19158_08875 [Vibrio scophthalmi LMG 19158]